VWGRSIANSLLVRQALATCFICGPDLKPRYIRLVGLLRNLEPMAPGNTVNGFQATANLMGVDLKRVRPTFMGLEWGTRYLGIELVSELDPGANTKIVLAMGLDVTRFRSPQQIKRAVSAVIICIDRKIVAASRV
jgi:hypothetical protein